MLLKITYKPTFFVDAMLGNIARKLRLSGYDSQYFSDIDDDKLIDSAKKENRIVVSSDEELIKKTKKLGMKSIYVTKKEENEQFFEIISNIKLQRIQINGSVARCPKCNSLTELVDKNSVKEKISQGVIKLNDKFWRCKSCNQIYWEGTHIKNLQNFVGMINERLQ
jgi:uncharacterized protein with PIN domain